MDGQGPVPAGSVGIRNFEKHCTACQLCISVCPNQVLRPSAGLMTLMQPEMSYEKGYCRPECSDVCPAGAIRMVLSNAGDPGSPEIPAINTEKCIGCGQCSPHCPQRIDIPKEMQRISQYVETLRTTE